MTAKEIAQLIESPERCTSADLQEIEKLAEKYPYAQTFPILMLQQLGRSKSLEFEDQLNKHAFKVADRAQLYFLINDGNTPSPEVEKTVLEEPIGVDSETTLDEPVLTIVPEDVEPIETNVDEIIVSETVENETDILQDFVRNEVEIDPQEDMKDVDFVQVEEMTFEPVTIDFDDDSGFVDELETDIEAEIKEEPIEIVESQETFEDEVVVDTDNDILHKHEVEDVSKHDEYIENIPQTETSHEEEIDTENDLEVAEAVIEFMPLEAFDPTAEILSPEVESELEEALPSSFEEESKSISIEINSEEVVEADEITSNAIAAGYQISESSEDEIIEETKTPEPEIETEEVVQEFEDKIAAEKRSFMDWLKVSATTNSPEYQVKQQRAVEIMDRFIKDDPKIQRISKTEEPEKKAAEFFKVSTIAKESLNEDVMPVSETLAQIYVDQGNFGKAIDAYNQLLLLNPEKKSFFANQIKKLKKRIKN